MGAIEPGSHSFIVKVWLEESGPGSPRGSWRGYITHVADNERRYLENLSEILLFIRPYLERMGVKLGWWSKVRGGWAHRKR
jgi:hypothetical protein